MVGGHDGKHGVIPNWNSLVDVSGTVFGGFALINKQNDCLSFEDVVLWFCYCSMRVLCIKPREEMAASQFLLAPFLTEMGAFFS